MNVLLRHPFAYCVAGIACAFSEAIRADWAGLAVLCSLIAVYAFLARGDRDDGRFRTGDNSYFIGFVYTLSVITLSLILDADTLLDGAGHGVSPLLKTIGIALGTSVAGMLCRFLLTHDIPVAEDEFDAAVRNAAVAAASLEGAARKAAESAAPLAGAVREAAEAAMPLVRIVNEVRQTVDGASQALKAQVRANGSSLSDFVQEFRGRLEDLANDAAASLTAMTKGAIDDTQEAVRTLAERTAAENADTMRDLRQNLNAHPEAVRASLDRIASSLDAYTEVVHASAQRFGQTLDKATRQALGEVAKGVAESLQANTFADARRGLDGAVRTYEDGVAVVSRTLTSAVDGLGHAAKAAVTQAGEARAALIEIDSAAFRRDLEGLREAIGRLGETANTLNDRLPSLVGRGPAPPVRPPLEPPRTGEDRRGGWLPWTRR